LEQLGVDGGDQSNLSISSQIDRLATDISFRGLLQAGKCLAPIPGLGGPRYLRVRPDGPIASFCGNAALQSHSE
jgi:hypothetical protein